MAMVEVVEATATEVTEAAATAIELSGPAVFAVSPGKLVGNETVKVLAEDADGGFSEILHIFRSGQASSVLLETYREVKVIKTVTEADVAVAYGQ